MSSMHRTPRIVIAIAAAAAVLTTTFAARTERSEKVAGGQEAASPAAQVPQPARHHFVQRGAGKTYPRDLVRTEAKLTAVMTDGRYSFLDEIWNPGFVVRPHFHVEHSETFYVLSGQVEWTVNGETRLMDAGDLVYIPPDVVHAVKVVGNQDVRTLMIYEPGGYEDFMDEEAKYTPEQRQQPKVVDLLRSVDDFNPVERMPRQSGPPAVAAERDQPAARPTPVRIAAPTPAPARHHFSLKQKGEIFRDDSETSEVKLTAVHTDGRYSFLDEIWRPGMSVPPHFHARHSETFYVIGGQVEWTVGGETRLMGAGELVYIPPDTVHSVKVVGNQDLHTLMIYNPGGYEYHSRREAQYTPEQRRQPEIQRMLRQMNDFHPVTR